MGKVLLGFIIGGGAGFYFASRGCRPLIDAGAAMAAEAQAYRDLYGPLPPENDPNRGYAYPSLNDCYPMLNDYQNYSNVPTISRQRGQYVLTR